MEVNQSESGFEMVARKAWLLGVLRCVGVPMVAGRKACARHQITCLLLFCIKKETTKTIEKKTRTITL